MQDPKSLNDQDVNEVANSGVPTEQEMREMEAPWFNTYEELNDYIRGLIDRPHTYGTCVYAMSLAAVATFNFVAGKIGTTGFQASCADLDILRQTRHFEWGKLLNYKDLLYPQNINNNHFPSIDYLMKEHKEKLAQLAQELIDRSGEMAHPDVLNHWKMLVERGTK